MGRGYGGGKVKTQRLLRWGVEGFYPMPPVIGGGEFGNPAPAYAGGIDGFYPMPFLIGGRELVTQRLLR